MRFARGERDGAARDAGGAARLFLRHRWHVAAAADHRSGSRQGAVFLRRSIDASTAERWGLVNWVVPAGQALADAKRRADRLAGGATVAIREIKRLVDEGLEVPLQEGLTLEQASGVRIGQSEDATEGVRAFLERRPAVFRGR